MHNHLPSAHDVAKLAGVSQSAVSRAFTEGASISKTTKEKVILAANTLGYRPNLIARSLIKGQSNIIGVGIGNFANDFFPLALDALSNKLSTIGKRLLVFTSGPHGPQDHHVEELLNYQVDALILLSTNLSSELALQCERAGIPVVLFNRTSQLSQTCSVIGENEKGARLIAEHLLQAKYKNIAFMAGIDDSSTSQEREKAFTDYLKTNAGITPIREAGLFTREGAMQACRKLLNRRKRPDAIFCANDHMALAACDIARYEFGLEIGKEIGIVGFDNIPQTAYPSYDLTTYSQPIEEMAEQTMQLIKPGSLENIDTQTVVVSGELIIRSSTSGAL
jgi:DNA-binding LacI/PurR family transcriptional regulator